MSLNRIAGKAYVRQPLPNGYGIGVGRCVSFSLNVLAIEVYIVKLSLKLRILGTGKCWRMFAILPLVFVVFYGPGGTRSTRK